MGLQQASILYKDNPYAHYYLCNYLPLSAGKDSLSHSLLKFKRGRQPDLNAWIDCSLEMLQTAPPPSTSRSISPDNNTIPADNSIIPPDSYILRALHHDETIIPQHHHTSLDRLGSALAQQFKSHYHPRLLRKTFPTQQIKELNREQREAGLKGLYTIDKTQFPTPHIPVSPPPEDPTPENTTPTSFLIIDDILTTGTTMKMIIDAILPVYPTASITLFTLAKADYDPASTNPPRSGDKIISSDKTTVRQ